MASPTLRLRHHAEKTNPNAQLLKEGTTLLLAHEVSQELAEDVPVERAPQDPYLRASSEPLPISSLQSLFVTPSLLAALKWKAADLRRRDREEL